MAASWDVATMMKAALREEAKGKLRALVAVQGSFYDSTLASDPRSDEGMTFDSLEASVAAFIKEIEDRGLHE